MQDEKILVWLPFPMGDAILCTPALRALRRYFKNSKITFYGNSVVRQVLSPGRFNDVWLEQKEKNPFKIAKKFREHKFTSAVLFKNSFASALAIFLAAIPSRIGYAREGRGFLLTEKLYPPKLSATGFKPFSMIDYYLAIVSWLGCDTSDKNPELLIDPKAAETLKDKLPQITQANGPIVVLVPGGAFGPSKCWLSKRFAQTADWLIDNYGATVIVSVSPAAAEKRIADEICSSSANKLINLAETPLSLTELKSLFSIAALVITNDTGPRHIAGALKCNIITLFGPNNPEWTEADYRNEIQIIGKAPCVPCDKPVCKQKQHFCMQAITVEMVCKAAEKLLEIKSSSTEFRV